jgi:DNA-binding response OmpR family regulator
MSTHVLVIEDDPPIVDVIASALSGEGYEVRASYDLEALIWAREGWPDAILLDLMLVYLDGQDMLKYLHRHPATTHIPIILMTAIPDTFDAAKTLGVTVELRKPFTLEALYAAVDAVTKGTRA